MIMVTMMVMTLGSWGLDARKPRKRAADGRR
jgi:hypothetical protein